MIATLRRFIGVSRKKVGAPLQEFVRCGKPGSTALFGSSRLVHLTLGRGRPTLPRTWERAPMKTLYRCTAAILGLVALGGADAAAPQAADFCSALKKVVAATAETPMWK